MRKINCNELVTLSDSFTGKEIQVFLSPIKSVNTYYHFRLRDDGDVIELYEINYDKPTPQELRISKDSIKEIQYFEGKNVYETVFSILLKDGQIDFAISEKPLYCKKCKRLLDKCIDQTWQIDQIGGYGSHYDGEKVCVNLCDNCLMNFLGYEVGEDSE